MSTPLNRVFATCKTVLTTSFLLLRESEAAYLASLTDSLSAGTTWSRICDLIELENSQSKTLARTGAGTTDLSRWELLPVHVVCFHAVHNLMTP